MSGSMRPRAPTSSSTCAGWSVSTRSPKSGLPEPMPPTMNQDPADVVIIGSCVGGGGVAFQVAGSGAKVLALERGQFLPREPQNWDLEEVFVKQCYTTDDISQAD